MPYKYKLRVTLHSLERLNNSVNANPRWNVHTSEGTFPTRSDASVNYGIQNDSPVGKEVELTISGKSVIDMRIVEG